MQDPLSLDVVVEPAAQAWPFAGQGLVGEGDVAVVAGEQARADQELHQPLLLGTGDDAVAREIRIRVGSPSGPGATSRISRSRSWSR